MAISSEMGSYLLIPIDWTYSDVLHDFNHVYNTSMEFLEQEKHDLVSKAFLFFFEFDSRLKYLLEEISKGNFNFHSEPVSMETENQLLTLQGNLAFYQLELFGKITEYLEKKFYFIKEITNVNTRNEQFAKLSKQFQLYEQRFESLWGKSIDKSFLINLTRIFNLTKELIIAENIQINYH